jgi:hypothetical protein
VPDAYDSQLLNRYAYVRNNPVNKIDPTGNTPVGFEGIAGDFLGHDLFDPFGGVAAQQAFVGPPPPREPMSDLEFLLYEDLEAAQIAEASRTVVLRGEEWIGRSLGVTLAAAGGPLGPSLRGLAVAAVEDQVGFAPRGLSARGVPQLVYRGGSRTPTNLTPRPGVDTTGLSTFETLEQAVGPGQKAQVIDTMRLRSLCAVCDPQHKTRISSSL